MGVKIKNDVCFKTFKMDESIEKLRDDILLTTSFLSQTTKCFILSFENNNKRKRRLLITDDDGPPLIEEEKSYHRKKIKKIHEKKEDYKLHNFPQILLRPDKAGIIDFLKHRTHLDIDWAKSIVEISEKKLNQVKSGEVDFGFRIFLKSFKPLDYLQYKFQLTISNIFFFHLLFSDDVINTKTGQVSIFPVTVHQSQNELNEKTNGFPCMLVQVSHIRHLMEKKYSATKRLYQEQYSTNLKKEEFSCFFSCENDDIDLIRISGFDACTGYERKDAKGFILIPAHWLNVMKYYFLNPETQKVFDIGYLMKTFYQKTHFAQKFDEICRCMWLGHEYPKISIQSVVREPESSPNSSAKNMESNSMAHCRAFRNKIRNTYDNQLWKCWDLKYCKNVLEYCKSKTQNEDESKFDECLYDDLSFGYGVECWDEQLKILNHAHSFFKIWGDDEKSPYHMTGLFKSNRLENIKTRSESIQQGILFNMTLEDELEMIHHASEKFEKDLEYVKKIYGDEEFEKFWNIRKRKNL